MVDDGAAPRDFDAGRTELKADMHRAEPGRADFRAEVARKPGQVRAEVGAVRTEVTGPGASR